ncbi:MAG: AAA family ATPase [Phycisphaerae bacterium]
MLTRIEIDGFKSFRDFEVELLPFQVILGANSAGKSNFFDALQFLSRLADSDLATAMRGMRGEPEELFSHGPGGVASRMQFGLDLLLDLSVRDPWGVDKQLTNTRVRYELTLARRDVGGIERLFVTNETAKPILKRADRWVSDAAVPKTFRDSYVRRTQRGPFLETTTEDDRPVFSISQDGHQGRKRPAHAAESTILSGITNTEFAHLFALREELRAWRFLQLNPEALRQPSPQLSPDTLTHDGSNLAAVLARLRSETAEAERPEGILADVSLALTHLVPDVRRLDVVEDRERKEYRIDVTMQDGQRFPSRVLSDGTLRILALLTLMHDPKNRGLLCFEEPENGVHPFRLGQLIETLRNLTTDVTDGEPDETEPLRQVLMNSHSPVVLNNLQDTEALFADAVTRVEGGEITRATRIRPVSSSLLPTDPGHVSGELVRRYLEAAAPTETQA